MILTDEEIKRIGEGNTGSWQDDLQFDRAIESAVLEKLNPRVAELEAVLGECRGVLSFINRLDDDRDFLDQPEYEQIHKAIAKIDEVLGK